MSAPGRRPAGEGESAGILESLRGFTRLGRRARLDDGSILLLTSFYTFLALVLVLLLTSASSLYLFHARLLGLADAAALAGAEAFDLQSATLDGTLVRPVLTDALVESAVREYFSALPRRGIADLQVTRAGTSDDQGAVVELRAVWRPPLLSALVPQGVPVTAEGSARAVFH